MTRLLQIMLLPLLVVALPLIYLMAWMREALSDLSLRPIPIERSNTVPNRRR